MSLISLEFAGRLVNGLVAIAAYKLPLQYELPQDEIYHTDYGKALLLGAAGVSFWAGMKLALKTEEYFKQRIEFSKQTGHSNTFFSQDDKLKGSLFTTLGIAAFFYLLNISKVNQIFERNAPYYTSIGIRGLGYGYLTMNTVRALDALFHRDVT
ncbi:MAG: hypothetical protein JSS10_07570 [Verrucomicrobia bacterium]|nr:hypothetical protein [Verrucomicrobiota bacterium]